MESSSLEYYTPRGKDLFSAGSGGIINLNVRHMAKAMSQTEENIQRQEMNDVKRHNPIKI